MEQWSREMRYRKYEEVDEKEILALQEKVKSSPYRQIFHIQPPTGLLSHPSGLIFFKAHF